MHLGRAGDTLADRVDPEEPNARQSQGQQGTFHTQVVAWSGVGQRTKAVAVPEMSLMPTHIVLLATLVMTFKEGLGWHSPVNARKLSY